MTAENPADAVIGPTEFALQIMTKAYGYQECVSFATVQDGKSEPDGWCLTHDQSYRYCREYQDEILTPLLALIEARDATLADPADREPEKIAACELLLADLGKTLTRVSAARDELRATVARVRALADEWTNDLKSYPNRAVEVRRDDLRAALDGAGEQHE